MLKIFNRTVANKITLLYRLSSHAFQFPVAFKEVNPDLRNKGLTGKGLKKQQRANKKMDEIFKNIKTTDKPKGPSN